MSIMAIIPPEKLVMSHFEEFIKPPIKGTKSAT